MCFLRVVCLIVAWIYLHGTWPPCSTAQILFTIVDAPIFQIILRLVEMFLMASVYQCMIVTFVVLVICVLDVSDKELGITRHQQRAQHQRSGITSIKLLC